MSTSKRFIAKNGVDNNNNTIQNVADPVNLQDSATKNFASNASNLTSGTVLAARLPSFSGDVTSSTGSSVLTLASVATAGTYKSVTVDAKGRVTAGTNPTTLSGYGITDAPTVTGTGASGTWGIGITGNAATASNVTATVTGTNETNLVYGNMADNDQARIRIGGTASNAGWLEIATADDGSEPIYVRQYTGTFTTVARTLTLLDGSGNTSIPGNLDVSSINTVNPKLNGVYGNLGSPTVTEKALFHGEFNNKFRFNPASIQEESTDGITWTTSARASANALADIMLGEGQTGGFNAIPAMAVGGSGYYRLTWNASSTGYVYLDAFYMYCSTNGNNVTFKIEAEHNTNGWTTIASGTKNNWPGHIYIPHSTIPFNTSDSTKYKNVRVTLSVTSATNTNAISINAIEWFGGYPAGKRNVESYDRNKNVSFPAAITGTSLVSTVATGTAPLSVTSNTVVTNLNSDLLDSQEGSYYLDWTNATNKPSPVVTVTLAGDVTGTANATLTSLGNGTITVNTTISADSVILGTDTTGNYVASVGVSGTGLSVSGTGESAAVTITSNATNTNTASTIVARDASGNFSAGTITANLTGTASSANLVTNTNLGSTSATSNTTTNTASLWSGLPVGYSAFMASSIGTGGGLPVANYGYFHKVANRDTAGGWGGIWVGYAADQNYVGRTADSATLPTWNKLLIDGGAGSITGNSGTATKLATARTIATSGDATGTATSFDGSANITIPLTLANSGVTAGTYNNSATSVTPFTVDAKGRITATGTAVTITPAWSSITSKPTTLATLSLTDLTAMSSTTPSMDGTATIGVGTTAARADHIHPTDTTRSPLAGSSSLTTLGTISSGTWNGTTIGVGYGGSGTTTAPTQGGVIYGASATAYGSSAAGTTGQILTSGGTGAPTWGYLDLAVHAPDSSYKKICRVATTSYLSASTFSGNVLTGYPNSQNLVCTTTAESTSITTTSTAGLLVGAVVSTATTQLAAGTTVSAISSSTVFTVSNRAAITTTAITGTGSVATATFASQTYIPYAVGSRIVVSGTTPTTYSGTFTVTACTTTSVSWSSTETTTATVQGSINFTIAAGTSITTAFAQSISALAIDGVTLALNDRVLVKDQRMLAGLVASDAAKYNGIYYVSAIGSTTVPWSLTRTPDADAASDLDGAIVNISVGTVNYGRSFKTRFKGTDTLNTTPMYWSRFADVNASALTASPTTAIGVDIATDTETIMYSSTGTIADFAANSIGIKTLQGTAATTYTRGSSLYIAGAPVASTNVTLTTPYSLYIASGNSYTAGNLTIGGTIAITGNSTLTGDIAINGGDITTSSTTMNYTTATATTVNIGSAATSFSTSTTTATSTMNIATGATISASTKTVNIGTGGVSGSITNVNIGSAASTGTTIINNDTTINSVGFISLPDGTTAQRPSLPVNGMIRYNTDIGALEGYIMGAWMTIGAVANGAIYENSQVISSNYTINSGKNAFSAGPVTINSGVTVTIPSGSNWVVM